MLVQPTVYWAARDMRNWWAPHNHHFVLIVTPVPVGGHTPVHHRDEGFITLGAFNVNGNYAFQANDLMDVMSVKEKINIAPSWRTGFQDHKVSKEGLAFAADLVRHARIFKQNSMVEPWPFEMVGSHAAPWVSSILRVCGIASNECWRIGRYDTYPKDQVMWFPEKMFRNQPSTNPPANPGQPRGQNVHTVKPGEWLSKIAIHYYGDMNKWPVIYEANKDTIGLNPDAIQIGQRLIIP